MSSFSPNYRQDWETLLVSRQSLLNLKPPRFATATSSSPDNVDTLSLFPPLGISRDFSYFFIQISLPLSAPWSWSRGRRNNKKKLLIPWSSSMLVLYPSWDTIRFDSITLAVDILWLWNLIFGFSSLAPFLRFSGNCFLYTCSIQQVILSQVFQLCFFLHSYAWLLDSELRYLLLFGLWKPNKKRVHFAGNSS